MHRLRAFRRFLSWLTLFAVLGGAMAPTISHALARGKAGQGWLEVCTAQGIRLVSMDVGTQASTSEHEKQGQQAPPHAFLEHCPFCVPHGGSVALPAIPEIAFALPATVSAYYPPLYFSAPRSLFVWATANPRAPPILSA